jgi:DNA-binding response OmpR family regulator
MDTPARILLADDEELILYATADLLAQEGYQVDCALDGPTALALLREHVYDLLISDIRMPGNSDLALVQSLPEPNRGLPVILVTGYPSAESAIQAVNLAVLAYLVKPMEFPELLAQVRRGVAQRRMQAAVAGSARHLQDWAGEMGRMAEGFGAPGGVPAQRVLGAMLGRLGEVLADLQRLVDLGGADGADAQACSVQRCPRLERYDHLVRDGIAVLEKTKGAFKSKTLEELRLRMEKTVADGAATGPRG